MNTLHIESLLAKKYHYTPLAEDLSKKYREYFTENIPHFLSIDGSANQCLYTLAGTKICQGYSRIVVGDYGAFIEFSEDNLRSDLIIQPGQEYRITDKKYSKNVKYIWYTIADRSHIKVYHQKKRVAYADYRPYLYYVSVHEVLGEPK